MCFSHCFNPVLTEKRKSPETIASRDSSISKSDSVGTRTQDPYIKSVLLYQLSYEIINKELYYYPFHS